MKKWPQTETGSQTNEFTLVQKLNHLFALLKEPQT